MKNDKPDDGGSEFATAGSSRKSKKEDGLVKVKLIKTHHHKERECQPGDSIEVRPDQEKWLKKHETIA